MALSQIVKQECTKCGKIAIEESRVKLGSTVLIKLACGHLMSYASSVSKDESVYDSIVFSDGKKPRPYQIDAIKFAEAANFNLIIADEQGLGKTIEAAGLLRLHPAKLLPAVIVVPTTVKLQWMWEIDRICVAGNPENKRTFLTQVIQSGKEKAMPGFQIYIITFDMLKKDDVFEYVSDVKTIIIDECQRIKNHLSDRAKAVQKIAKKCEYRIPMSGTPIKNHAGEYFTVLNIVDPIRFPHYQRYLDNYCDYYNNGWSNKIGGLKDPERFHEDTKDIIIRRTKDQVLKDLPSLDRKFYHVDLDPKLNKAYAKALEELDELFYSDMSAFERGTATIAIMGKLRHITGISKIDECVDFASEFLLSAEDIETPQFRQEIVITNGVQVTNHIDEGSKKRPRKLTIFTHHQDVMDILKNKLNALCTDGGFEPVLTLHSGLNGDQRAELVKKFKEGSNRVMIASTLAAGEGLNLQFCSDAILLERQWNPANEEQVEARFHRFGQENNVSVTYFIAIGTIDEYFTELVETKRSIVSSTLDNKQIQWDQQSLMASLTEMLVTKGRERWRL